MSSAYTKHNAAEREHLEKVIARLSEKDYSRPVGASGWTVTSALGHLAFWDQRALALIAKWKREGIGPSAMDTDVVNDTLVWLCAAIPGREVARLAREAAAAIDREIDSLPVDLLARMEKDGTAVRLDRGLHREHHLAQIERALGWT
jgi:hypothetical protein